MKVKICLIVGIIFLPVLFLFGNGSEYVLKQEFILTENDIRLSTDIYLTDENRKYPVILVRTPYSKENFKSSAEKLLKQGFAVVVQDCRGKFDSEGEFYAFKNERIDGLKTVSWIRKQTWCNSKIAGYGSSYNAYTQLAISDELDAVVSELGSSGLYDLLYPQGLFSLATACNWGLPIDSKTMNPVSTEKLLQSYWYLPLSIADDSTFKDNRFFNDWLLHESDDSYWKSMAYRGISKGPTLSIAGWYDIFLLAQFNDFIELEKNNKNQDNKLIIGPWCHGPQAFRNDYGGSSKTGQREALQNRFLTNHILSSNEKILLDPFANYKYNFFIMERNEYFGSELWPPKEVIKKEYYLNVGKISTNKSVNTDSVKFIFNPSDPMLCLGGNYIGMEVGPAIQNQNIKRTDQLVFETEMLDSPLILLGKISAKLFLSSTVSQTDFIILVQDVFPNDTIINIQEGGKTVKIDQGKINCIELESWPTGYQLNNGHKLRIVITSSWFPRYNRNLNKGEQTYHAKEYETATNTIYFGEKYPSKISLPLLNINQKSHEKIH